MTSAGLRWAWSRAMDATDSLDRSLLAAWKLWAVAITVVTFAVLLKYNVYVRGWLMYMPTLYRDLLVGIFLLHTVIHCGMSGGIFSSARAGWTIAMSHEIGRASCRERV